MSLNTQEILKQFGAYYLEEGQNMERLRSAIRQPSVTASYARSLITESDMYRSANSILGEVIQQFQKKFTEKGQLDFLPNEIPLRNMKVDMAMYPDDLKASWLGFLTSLTEQERANWPIVRYALEHEIAPQIQQDLEMKAYWSGKYKAPILGTPGSADEVMDGIKTLIDAGLANNTMNAIALPDTLRKDNVFDMVEEFTDSIDQVLDPVPMNIYMSYSWLRAYYRDKRNTHGTDINYVAGTPTVDFAPNRTLVGLPSMKDSDYLWATPVDNYVHLRKVNGMTEPRLEESKREVFFLSDWWEGLGFLYNPLVYAYKP